MLTLVLASLFLASVSHAAPAPQWFDLPLKGFKKEVATACHSKLKVVMGFKPERVAVDRRALLASNLKELEKAAVELCKKHLRYPSSDTVVLLDQASGRPEDEDFYDGKNGFALGSPRFKSRIHEDAALSLLFLYAEVFSLILKSTPNYAEALSFAQKAATDLKIKMDLRELVPHEKTGLTWNEMACDESGWTYPCYVSRARQPAGKSISIEYSDAFYGFQRGYYIVLAGMASKPNAGFAAAELEAIKRSVPDAYIKSTSVYVGCMH